MLKLLLEEKSEVIESRKPPQFLLLPLLLQFCGLLQPPSSSMYHSRNVWPLSTSKLSKIVSFQQTIAIGLKSKIWKDLLECGFRSNFVFVRRQDFRNNQEFRSDFSRNRHSNLAPRVSFWDDMINEICLLKFSARQTVWLSRFC